VNIGDTITDLAYAPRSNVRHWLNGGWRLVPGVEYAANDYAILMVRPELAEPVSVDAVIRHLWRHANPAATCSEEGCNNVHHAYGLCGKHYKRLRKAGHTFGPKRLLTCSEPGCTSTDRVQGQSLCNKHYHRLKRKCRRARKLLEAA
jgi:hypothetical protein